MLFQIITNLRKYFQYIFLKQHACKWTHTVQTCGVQGSTVLCIRKKSQISFDAETGMKLQLFHNFLFRILSKQLFILIG